MRGLFNNLGIKIVALILGLLLWFHVATERIYHHQVVLPLKDILLDKELTLSKNPPDSIEVMVMATGKQLLRRSWREEGLRLSAISLTAGQHTVNLSPLNLGLVSPNEEVTLQSVVFPAAIELFVDRQTERKVPVTLDVTLLPDEGFAVQGPSVPEPVEVTLVGPRSLIRELAAITTERRELSGLRNGVTMVVPLKYPDIFGLRVQPDTVSLTVEVVPVRSRLYRQIPVVIFNQPDGFRITMKPETVDVTISGPPVIVDSLPATALVASIDFGSVTPGGRARIRVDCPTLVRVRDQSVDSVQVTVR